MNWTKEEKYELSKLLCQVPKEVGYICISAAKKSKLTDLLSKDSLGQEILGLDAEENKNVKMFDDKIDSLIYELDS